MDPSRKTLLDIARISRRILDMLAKHGGGKTVESFQLEKIVFVSGTIVETLNKALHLGAGAVDARISDWLVGDEPKTCLNILIRMEAILGSKPDDGRGMMNFFQPHDRRLLSQGKSHEAIKLFIKHESYFHFLISTEIWSHANTSSARQAPKVAVTAESSRINTGMKQELEQNAHIDVGTFARKRFDTTKVNSIVTWLNESNTNPKSIHLRTLNLRQEGTCIWLPKTNAYRTWRHAENSFLWLHGKPGAGKSVLAASVIDALEHSLQFGEVLAYFYFDFRVEQSMSGLKAMRSLLSQLLQQFKTHAGDPGDLIDELTKKKNEQDFANAKDFASYISQAAKCLQQQPFIVIDALDECNDVGMLLDALEELKKGGIRLFVTSRPLQEIKEHFQSLPLINMDMMNYETLSDIKLHVTREVDSHRRLRIMGKGLKDEICSILGKKANGMFRWVQCQLNVIKRCVTAAQVKEALDKLPSDLDETYDRILLRISTDENQLKVAQRALGWLVVALVPLELSQIMEALSVDPVRQVVDHDSAPVHGPALLDVLGSLVSYDELTDIVILAHFSVKEYLTSYRAQRSASHVDKQDMHTQVALLCICYITVYLDGSGHVNAPLRKVLATKAGLDDSGHPSQSIQHPTSQQPSFMFHSLYKYALDSGFKHLAHVNGYNKVLRAIRNLHSAVQQHYSQWSHLCSTVRIREELPTLKHDFMLFILIAFASEPLLRVYLNHSRLQINDGTNPLIYAAYFDKIEHAKILLSRGADLNRRGLYVHNDSQVLPLEVAVRQGKSDIVDLFLANGSTVPHRVFVAALRPGDCVFLARIVSRLLQTDEFVDWATNVQDKELFFRALDSARYRYFIFPRANITFGRYESPSEQDLDVIKRRLLQLGYDPSTHLDETSLRHAVSAGLVSTVRQILSLNISLPNDILLDASRCMVSNVETITLCVEMGADVLAVSSTGDTPLHLALKPFFPFDSAISEDVSSENISALIDAGCNASRCNLAGETPLHLAVALGYMSIAELLLPLTISLPHDILLTASESHNPPIIRLLISQGANVHAIAANGDTTLHRLLHECGTFLEQEENLDCVKILVDAGCNAGLPNADGTTPFIYAAEREHLSVLQYLYDTLNCPLPPNILVSVASSMMLYKTSITKFLLNKGANIHVAPPNGDFLLHLFMKNTRREIECLNVTKLLVDAGCDPCTRNLSGQTLYHIAAENEYTSVIEYLLSVGAGPLPPDIIAPRFRYKPLPTIRFLMGLGGDVHAVAKNGDTLLHAAARLREEEDALELAQHLVRSGCTPCPLNSLGKTPLHVAARKGFISVVQYLLSLDITIPHDILLAASTGSSEKAQLIRYLIDQGADISVTTTSKNNPLHLLLAGGMEDDRLECLRMLIHAGCDPRAKNLAGETPLHCAARCGFKNIMEYFLSQDVSLPRNILLFASATATLRFLLRRGQDLRNIAPAGVTDLMCRVLGSSETNATEFAKILISAGWDPSQKDSVGKRLIHAATRNGNFDAIKFFLSQNVPLPSDILFTAVTAKDKEMKDLSALSALTCLLIYEGASIHVTASNGDTALHLAMTRRFQHSFYSLRDWRLVEILLNSGSDPSAPNQDGKTPFDLATEKGCFFNDNFLRLVKNSGMHCPRC